MMDLKSLAIEECEKIPSNDKILLGSFDITHEVVRKTSDNIMEEHTIIIEWVQWRGSEGKNE